MKMRITSAEGDYIKIGDKIIPTNTADLGYRSFDEVAREGRRRYDKEKADEAEAIRIENARKAGEENKQAIQEALTHSDSEIQAYFDVLVPPSGKADTIAGELVRAIMRIMYRDWNDGDRFYEGYGWETCMPSASYLMDYFDGNPIKDKFIEIAQKQFMSDEEYTQALQDICDDILYYIDDHPELLGEVNEEDSRDYHIPYYYEELEGKYEFDFSFPDAIVEMMRQGLVSYDDIRYELESWENLSKGDLEVYEDSASVSDLDKETYEELERSIDGDLRYWEEEWISEYEDPYYDEYDDEYDDDYEDEDEE